jgi:hypothetical protein
MGGATGFAWLAMVRNLSQKGAVSVGPANYLSRRASFPPIWPHQDLCKSVNKSLKWPMLLTALSLSLLANQQLPAPSAIPQAERIARASVQILAAEEIRFDDKTARDRGAKQLQRQQRTREGMPMVEFY